MVDQVLPRLAVSEPAVYTIRVQGLLDPDWSGQLGDLHVAIESAGPASPVTRIAGRVADQAALNGTPNLLYQLGLPLLSLERLVGGRAYTFLDDAVRSTAWYSEVLAGGFRAGPREEKGMGPVEVIVVAFPGNQFKGDILPALHDIVDQGLIRIFDLVFVKKDAEGNVEAVELAEMDPTQGLQFEAVTDDVSGLLSPEDVQRVGEMMEPNSSGALLLFEHVWATRLQDAILGANGMLIFNERIPRDVVEEALSAAAEA
ncbi:MAG: DUF6325 family protein [Dehalococcoidia bacterium]